MDRDALIEQLAEDILSYVMSGTIEETNIARGLKHETLDRRFNDYELLLDLHFVLRKDVVNFIRKLPTRLRSIRTETQSITETKRGSVNGRINWSETIKKRHSESPNDRSLFVVENRSVDYDIPENIVLKSLISRIHDTLCEAENFLDSEYDWVSQRWMAEENLIENLTSIVERNVHVRRIRSPEVYEPTERMLTRASNAREKIYREASKLFRYRQNLQAGDKEALQELLSKTAINPKSDNRVFELYVLFRFISALESARNEKFTVNTITSNRDAIVKIRNNDKLDVYFDQSGPEGIRFDTEPNKQEVEFTRFEDVHYRTEKIADKFYGENGSKHTKRPDIFVQYQRSTGAHPKYLIVEIKNSTSEKTIQRGIKETLEYLAFLKRDGQYVFDSSSYYGDGLHGILVIQDIEKEVLSIREQAELPIRIVQASDLDDVLPSLLQEWLD